MRPRVKFHLLKDGVPVFESISKPTFLQFQMQELKPAHVWTIEEIPTMPYTIAEEKESLMREVNQITKKLRALQERGVE